MEMGGYWTVLVMFLLILLFLKSQWDRRQFPPGPMPFPILGTLWCFGFSWQQNTLSKLSEVYGKIFTIWIGPMPIVVVNGFHAVKQVLVNQAEETNWRVVTPFIRDSMKGKGILFSSGPAWKEQRRFAMATLRSLGLGRKSLEYRVQEEAGKLVEIFSSKKGKAFDPSLPLFHSISNVISSVVFGHYFSIHDESFSKLIECTEYMAHFFLSTFHLLYELSPWLMRHLPGPHQKAFSCLEFIHLFGRNEIQRHLEKKKPEDEPQDFIDFYLDEIDKKKHDPTSTFDEDNLVYVIYDLFAAGSDTVATTLRWALLFMVVHPDVQEKIQEEIDTVLTPSQGIFYEDRKNMPYTNAVIHEIQRFKFVLLVGTFRLCAKDCAVLGFPIKKGTVIAPDIASALYDPKQWETPHQFNPNHFLDKDGKFLTRDAFIPFSIAPVSGENLAKMELFLFLTNLLQAFTMQHLEGTKELSTRPVQGRFAVQPFPYMIRAVPRKAAA